MANGFHITAVKNYITHSNLVWVILRKISIQSTNTNSSLAHSVKMEKVHLYFSKNHGDVLLLFH